MLALSFGFAAGCESPNKPLGALCAEDGECGRGAACYQRQCVQLCAPGEACPPGTRCTSFRCLPNDSNGPESHSGKEGELPAPDPVAAELRAIRVELEALRRQHAEILEEMQARGD